MKAEVGFKLLGKMLCFKIGDAGEERLGRLIQIRIDNQEQLQVGILEDGYIEEYLMSDVQVIQNKERRRELAKAIVKQVNKDIDSFQYDLLVYYKDDIIEILKKIPDEGLIHQIQAVFDVSTHLESCQSLYDQLQASTLKQNEKELLSGLIAYKQHDQNKAYEVFSRRWLSESADKNDGNGCRDFILVADEFDNDVLCFYLLNEYFDKYGRYVGSVDYLNFWWKYLSYAVKYNNFALIEKMKIDTENVRSLMDTFIYIFCAYSMEHLAMGLVNQFSDGNNTILQRNNADVGDVERAIEELNLLKNYIPDTAEGYYLRFEACMHKIVAAYESGQVVNEEEDKFGYIYEFVKARKYGFIIGTDFQKYFCHEDYLGANLRQRIIDNIYSELEIEKEDKIYVSFRAETSNKRIQAYDIISVS